MLHFYTPWNFRGYKSGTLVENELNFVGFSPLYLKELPPFKHADISKK